MAVALPGNRSKSGEVLQPVWVFWEMDSFNQQDSYDGDHHRSTSKQLTFNQKYFHPSSGEGICGYEWSTGCGRTHCNCSVGQAELPCSVREGNMGSQQMPVSIAAPSWGPKTSLFIFMTIWQIISNCCLPYCATAEAASAFRSGSLA